MIFYGRNGLCYLCGIYQTHTNNRNNQPAKYQVTLSYPTLPRTSKSCYTRYNAPREYKPKPALHGNHSKHSNSNHLKPTNQANAFSSSPSFFERQRKRRTAQNLPSVISFMISLIIGRPFMIARSLIPMRLGLCFPPTPPATVPPTFPPRPMVPFLGLFNTFTPRP